VTRQHGRRSRFRDPVVVVGNGPVGQTVALLLAGWGVAVVVLDARPGRERVGSRAICQQRDVLDIWDCLGGVGTRLAEEGVTWTRARTFYRDRELFVTELEDGGGSPFPPFVNISQSRTEELLDERLADQPLVEVRWDHRVVDMAQDPDGVTVTCVTSAGTVQVRACYVVACPGARGVEVRRLLGVRFEGRTFADQFLICDLRADLPGWEQERRFYFDPVWNPGRQVLIHACPDSTFRIDWQVSEDFDLAVEETSGALDRRIRQVIGDRDYEMMWASVYRFSSRIADRLRVGKILLAGDAAHLMAPFGARGLNSGVQDAENAAWKIAFVVNGWAPEPLLETYHNERHAAAVENLAVTDATMQFLVPHDEVGWARRRAILQRAAGDMTAQTMVDSGRLAEPFWYVESALTTPNPTRPFTGRPVKGSVPEPGPGILMPDHPLTPASHQHAPAQRLRHLLRDGFTVLLGDDITIDTITDALADATAPITVAHFSDLSPRLAAAVDATPNEVWIIRPDAHIAACLTHPDPATIQAAVRRALAERN
jgi:3-(3-hydroxy-phenyl)propionate hydroxylase